MNFWTPILLGLLSLFSIAAASVAPKPTTPKPAASKPAASKPAASKPAASPKLSKYQQERLEQFKSSAPADQYFGRLRLSYLGINNTFRDAAITAGDHTTDPHIANRVAFADDALNDWANHFPHDPELARTYFLAIRTDKKIWARANQEKAWTYMNRIVMLFPNSYFGKLIKKDLAIGFTEHYYLDAHPCPTASPSPTPTPEPTLAAPATPAPSRKRRAAPAPSPSPEPTDTPTPQPSATPVPQPKHVAPGLKVQVLDPPCVQASATPAPSATPTAPVTPMAAASPTARATPAPKAS